MLMRSMWSHNSAGLDAMREAYRAGVRRMVLSGPTGSGKTHLAAGVIDAALEKGKRVAFVVSNLSLIDQTVDAFWREGITDIGVVQASHEMTNFSKPIQIVSIQTVGKRGVYPHADVIIVDECHVLYKAHHHWFTARPNGLFIGLSATPYAKGLGNVFQKLIKTGTTQQMIDLGILCPFKVFATGHPDMKGVRTLAGDYHEGDAAKAMQGGNLTADIITTYRKLWGKGKTLVFGVDCAHASTIAARYNEAGIKALYQDGDTPSVDRTAIKRAFHNGDADVVVNVGTLTTGTDWDVRCLQLCRPTKSEILLKQIIGRALRTAPGKDYALILDHSDSTSRIGFVTDIEYDDLDSTARPLNQVERAKPLPKLCTRCTALLTKRADNCWNCGLSFKVVSEILEDDGELYEVQRGVPMAKKGGKREYSMREKAEWFAQIKRYKIQRGKSDGWAAHTFKDKFGTWPNHPSIRHVEPADFVFTEVYSFIKHKNIAYARSLAKQGGARRV
jgi:superfamily II DNA or RNA helicase